MKTKFILGLILGIFLIGLVSASISGNLVRGGAFSTEGYKATLQKVDSNGVATISVINPEGTTKVVQVQEGETAKVGDAQISASGVTSGRFFRRAGADVSLNITGPAPKPITIRTGGVAVSGNQTNCTIPWLNQTQTNNNFTISIISSAGNVTANSSGVFVWAAQKGFKYSNDGKVNAKLQETPSNLRKWNCNRGWLDTFWLCNIK